MEARGAYTRLGSEVRHTERKTQLLAWTMEREAVHGVEAASRSWEDTVGLQWEPADASCETPFTLNSRTTV